MPGPLPFLGGPRTGSWFDTACLELVEACPELVEGGLTREGSPPAGTLFTPAAQSLSPKPVMGTRTLSSPDTVPFLTSSSRPARAAADVGSP